MSGWVSVHAYLFTHKFIFRAQKLGYVFCMCVNVKAETEEQMQNVHARILSQIEREEFFFPEHQEMLE